ncbi:hypothetical protein CAPTEDRAFT_219925 [Capitella teleta]|uniref:Uncharacterized protein n=1 Tax=Capitella teleta TaxID=283909 RepID=R7U278_CAPTE|nr:hypothetical protein CAPTEDRAFT_219925 [Capitella teleta]|eukprot:ELU00105.1 hypothetical protein CAPTEDRAFT_219925 [Capitella teleta]
MPGCKRKEIMHSEYRGADSNLRDYSGKKAKQYLRNSASTRAQQLLQNRRPSAASAGAAPFRRTGSYSSKIRSTGHFGIAAGTAVRNSWAQLAQAERRGSSQESLPSPKPSPKQSPQTWRKQSHSGSQELTMPPPRDLPVRHRRQSSRRDNKENHSDSELGAGGLSGSETDLTVGMDSAASYPNISVQKASYV